MIKPAFYNLWSQNKNRNTQKIINFIMDSLSNLWNPKYWHSPSHHHDELFLKKKVSQKTKAVLDPFTKSIKFVPRRLASDVIQKEFAKEQQQRVNKIDKKSMAAFDPEYSFRRNFVEFFLNIDNLMYLWLVFIVLMFVYFIFDLEKAFEKSIESIEKLNSKRAKEKKLSKKSLGWQRRTKRSIRNNRNRSQRKKQAIDMSQEELLQKLKELESSGSYFTTSFKYVFSIFLKFPFKIFSLIWGLLKFCGECLNVYLFPGMNLTPNPSRISGLDYRVNDEFVVR